jgi:hypothetical protein
LIDPNVSDNFSQVQPICIDLIQPLAVGIHQPSCGKSFVIFVHPARQNCIEAVRGSPLIDEHLGEHLLLIWPEIDFIVEIAE